MAKRSMRGTPKEKDIRAYWSTRLQAYLGQDISPETIMDSRFCFGCKVFLNKGITIQRAHIRAVSTGGSNSVENIHMLCRYCHKASELKFGEEYRGWLKGRDLIDTGLTLCAQAGSLKRDLLEGVGK